MAEKSIFITLEGGEGSGKSTIIKIIADKLTEAGQDIVVTREPGGIKSAEIIRKIIFEDITDPIAETLLYAAARREHLVKKLKPALEAGKIVLCDRFVDSSLVYQGIARGVGVDKVEKINKFVTEDLQPNLTFLLDLDPRIGIERTKKRTEAQNRFDKEKIDFHDAVRKGYLSLAAKYPDRIVIVDSSQPVDNIVEIVFGKINQLLKNN